MAVTVGEIFADYLPGTCELNDAEVLACRVQNDTRKMAITLSARRYIPAAVTDAAKDALRSALRLREIAIDCRFPGVPLCDAAIDDVIRELRAASPALNGYFNGAKYRLNGEKLDIELAYGGLSAIRATGFEQTFPARIRERFGAEVELSFSGTTETDQMLAPLPRDDPAPEPSAFSPAPQKSVPSAQSAPAVTGTRKRSDKPPDGYPVYLDSARLFYGRPITEKPVEMRSVKETDGTVTVWGEVFSKDVKPVKKGDKVIVTFAFSDGTDSMPAKIFLPKEKESSLDPLAIGTAVLAHGTFRYDDWGKEYYLQPQSLAILDVYEPTDEAAEKRVELHAHTSMSELDAVTSADGLIRRAHRWGHKAVAITDHGVVQAFPDVMNTASEIRKKDPDFKVIYGVEAYYIDDVTGQGGKTVETGVSPEKLPRYHMIILVQNQTGMKNLYKLVSLAHLKYYRKSYNPDNPQRLRMAKPLYPRSVIEQYREGLLIGGACEQGEIFRAILNGLPRERIEEIASFYDYLEIQPNGNNAFLLRSGRLPDENALNDINRAILELGDRLGKPVAATGDVHFLDKDDAILRTVLQCGQGFTDCGHQPPLYLKTTDEMLADFAYLGDRAAEVVVRNPQKIADSIDPGILPVPEGNYPPQIEGSDDILTRSTRQRARELYGDPLPQPIRERMDRELDAIIKHGFSVMYVTAQKLVEESEKCGYAVGSRGSVGSSFVAMLAGISEVNPLPPHYLCSECHHMEWMTDGSVGSGFDLPPKNCPQCGAALQRDGHNIPFETFLGFDGDKVPDIDLNFSGEVQSHIHRFTEEMFGTENVFKAGTISTVSDQTAYGYVKHYVEEFGVAMNKREEDRLAQRLSECKVQRTTSQHPGGMVVVPNGMEIYDFCPVQHPANKTDSDTITTHFDFHSIHDCILKLDELGHDVPTMYKYLEEYTGIPVNSVDLSDRKVMSLFTSTDALGVSPDDIDSPTGTFALPELGTKHARDMLMETMPKTFADLMQISGLGHGEAVWEGNAQDLIRAGTCTISEVIGTRDDIMTYLIRKGVPKKSAFRIMEIVRKGKAKKSLTEDDVRLMKDNGVPQWYIDSCFKIHYMFPKAHAAAYMIATLRLGWYKVYRPLEYYCAYFTVRGEDVELTTVLKGKEAVRRRRSEILAKDRDATDKEKKAADVLSIINEMLCRGIEVLPVDLKKSHATRYVAEDGKMRVPFSALGGVGGKAAVALYNAARRGHYTSRSDFQSEAGVSKAVMQALDSVGAFSFLPKSNQMDFF